jgi:uncharacterized membrane protein
LFLGVIALIPFSAALLSRYPTDRTAPAAGYTLATALGAAVPSIALLAFLAVPVPFVTGLFYRVLRKI